MGVFVAARLAIEGEEDQAPGIERGEERGDDQHPEGIAALRADKGAFDHGVFGGKARKPDPARQRDTHAGDGKRADHHRPESIGDLFAQRAIVPHILFMVHRMDHRTRAKEQHRLEKRVGEQVEHGDRIDAHARGHEHIAKLRTGRIGDHPFDVVLHQTHGCGKECRRRPEEGDKGRGLRCEFHQRRHAADQENTGGHHGCGVDQGRDRRRAFHRVGQPGVKDELRRFTHGPDKQQDRDQVGGVPFAPKKAQLCFGQTGRGGKDIVKLDAVGQVEKAKDTQGKAKVPHPVDHKGLDRGGIGRRLAIVKADQQVGRDTHTFPAKEHLDQVVTGHQHQHGKGKEGQIGEETRLIAFVVFPFRVMGHVAKAIEVHQGRHAGHNDQHGRGQAVQTDAPGGVERTAGNPAQDLNMLGFRPMA